MKIVDVIRLILSSVFLIACFNFSWLLGFFALGVIANAEVQTILNKRVEQRLAFLEKSILGVVQAVKMYAEAINR